MKLSFISVICEDAPESNTQSLAEAVNALVPEAEPCMVLCAN